MSSRAKENPISDPADLVPDAPLEPQDEPAVGDAPSSTPEPDETSSEPQDEPPVAEDLAPEPYDPHATQAPDWSELPNPSDQMNPFSIPAQPVVHGAPHLLNPANL